MTREKYAAAIDLTVDKFGLPDFIYQQKIVSDSDKEYVREIISQIKERMLHVSDRIAPVRTASLCHLENHSNRSSQHKRYLI
jgi:hypothetical protein